MTWSEARELLLNAVCVMQTGTDVDRPVQMHHDRMQPVLPRQRQTSNAFILLCVPPLLLSLELLQQYVGRLGVLERLYCPSSYPGFLLMACACT